MSSAQSASDPARMFVAVTKSDSVAIPEGQTSALFIGTGGDVVVPFGGTTVTFRNVPAGTILPIRVTRVNLTGTTAADIVALYQ